MDFRQTRRRRESSVREVRRLEGTKLPENTNFRDSTSSKRNCLSASPSELEFTFTSANLEPREKFVDITNYFSKPCPIQIFSAESQYFSVKNTQRKKRLNAGSMFRINVTFVPEETKDYHGVLNIQYFDVDKLSVKLSAKFLTEFSFPKHVDLGNVPLGRAAHYEIPMWSPSEKKFSFSVTPSREDPCVDVYPRRGDVTSDKKATSVMIIYRPLRYVSWNFRIRIFIPDSSKTPYVVNFSAYTRPGLLRDTLESINRDVEVDKTSRTETKVPPTKVERSKSNKEFLRVEPNNEDSLLKRLERLPLYTLHSVNCILNSKTKLTHHEHELRGPLNAYVSCANEQKFERQRDFLIKANEYRRENDRAKIHHKPKVRQADESDRIKIIKVEREQAWLDYEVSMITTPDDDLFRRRVAVKIRQRILRTLSKYPETRTVPAKNEDSLLRYLRLDPFVQAARKTVLRNRLVGRLARLKALTAEKIAQLEALGFD